jgi:hypothetical protein
MAKNASISHLEKMPYTVRKSGEMEPRVTESILRAFAVALEQHTE